MPDLFHLSQHGVTLAEQAPQPSLMLRLRGASEQDHAALAALLGFELPALPNRTAGSPDACRAIWMGPGEWMISGPAPSPAALEAAATDAAAALAVPVGDGRFALDVWGPEAADFLAGAIPIDLDPAALPLGASAMTLFNAQPVVIDRVAPDRLRLWFDISLRHYVLAWSCDALQVVA